MSGEEVEVRRGSADFATRVAHASGALNWFAIGGIAVAVFTGVIAVRPSERGEHTVREAAGLAAGSDFALAGPSGTAEAAFAAAPEQVTRDGTVGIVSAIDREEVHVLSAGADSAAADAGSDNLITGSILVAAAGTEKRRGSRKVVERKPAEKAVETPAAKSPEAAPSPTQSATPAVVEPAPAWSEDVIRSAREECTALMGNLSAEWSVAPPMRTTSCGAPGPITLRSVGKVTLAPAALTNCSTAAALARWMDEHVQPAAVKHFGLRVAQVSIATSYDCRNRYGLAQAPLSEHALANAIDLTSFKLTNGKVVTVLSGWGPTMRGTQTASAAGAAAPKTDGKAKGDAKVNAKSASQNGDRMGLGARSAEAAPAVKMTTSTASPPATPAANPVAPGAGARSAEAEFLHGVHSSACSVFGTVLGPEANEAHRDHFHLDMKHRRRNSFCQ